MRSLDSTTHGERVRRPSVDLLRAALAVSGDTEEVTQFWRVLRMGGGRPILVPASAGAPRAEVPFFVPGRILRRLLSVLIRADSAAHFLPRVPLRDPAKLASDFGYTDPAISVSEIRCGTKGPLQKASCLVRDGTGEPIALAKISLAESADPAIRRETASLRIVEAEFPEVASFTPRILATGILRSSRPYLVQELIPGTTALTRFGDLHRAFLASMASRGTQLSELRSSAAVTEINGMVAERHAPLPRDRKSCFQDALRASIDAFADPVPLCLVHGDFAHWNTRVRAGRLYVFDWEYCQRLGLPLKDLFHFILIPVAVARGPIGSAFERAVIESASVVARLSPGITWNRKKIVALGLMYMLETIAFYTRVNERFDLHDRVVGTYAAFLAEWHRRLR